jgi:Rhodopirellula transposase DDE domain
LSPRALPPARGRPAGREKKALKVLRELLREQTAGDPMGRRQWVRNSLDRLSQLMAERGCPVSPTTLRRLLHRLRYTLKANRKRFTGPRHPDRDRQFQYIACQRQRFNILSLPIISVDTKKKELLGNFKNPGRQWQRQPKEVNAHDFRDDAVGRSVPYGIYLPRQGRGYVYVGLSADTAAFAVDAIADWWARTGRRDFPDADELLILCDAGGCNGCRNRLWKQQIQEKLADRWGLAVTVCHYPRGASKWNPVEHELFSRISINWAGEPLVSAAVMLALIRGTRTAAGQPVRARLVRRVYRRGARVSVAEMKSLRLKRHETCPEWNYTIRPRWTIF